MKIGIFFGGSSREREVSFAGGRTVYDNLDKSFFTPVPIFVDAFGNLVKLNWELIYKGSIRDFYPPVSYLPDSQFQIYEESLSLTSTERIEMLSNIGEIIPIEKLKNTIDFAFLALHGKGGEDGSIQGLLTWLGIPFSGSGILPSAVGMSKSIQKKWIDRTIFPSPKFYVLSKTNWKSENYKEIFKAVEAQIGFPLVVKSANQGSSIGVSILKSSDLEAFIKAVDLAFFVKKVYQQDWNQFNADQKITYIKEICDLRSGLGFPLLVNDVEVMQHPDDLLAFLENTINWKSDAITLKALVNADHEVLIESYIEGREFSCIVIENTLGEPVALPPTGIIKKSEIFDYKAKYLPGLSRKVTPIEGTALEIQAIREAATKLYKYFEFDVYARIDGFINNTGTIFLNDPNTTSGMMPSSFFFHQAAEIGLQPSEFLTYIVYASLHKNKLKFSEKIAYNETLQALNLYLENRKSEINSKKKIAVIFGGYSSERHISVESGRNIFEKLFSSTAYFPEAIFLIGNDTQFRLFKIPIHLQLKDNADDIKNKILNYSTNPVIEQIRIECADISNLFSTNSAIAPLELTLNELAESYDFAFIALHGRPGEDGTLQKEFEKLHLPYNGSGYESSNITINKYETNEILAKHGMFTADHLRITLEEYNNNKNLEQTILKAFDYPFIAKPEDDGCSSAVVKINNSAMLEAYLNTIFRGDEVPDLKYLNILNIDPKEEFPRKKKALLEAFIQKDNSKHFLEVTGGVITEWDANGKIIYKALEPSESVAESAVLSLSEKFLAGEGLNITPARFSKIPEIQHKISAAVKKELVRAAQIMKVEGYCRIDAFVKIYENDTIEVFIIEINSLPGMTPATCIFHQAAIDHMSPYQFIDRIIQYGINKKSHVLK